MRIQNLSPPQEARQTSGCQKPVQEVAAAADPRHMGGERTHGYGMGRRKQVRWGDGVTSLQEAVAGNRFGPFS